MLRLLAVIAQGLGAKGMRRYQPPSAELAGMATVTAPADRRAQVLAAVMAGGGEAG